MGTPVNAAGVGSGSQPQHAAPPRCTGTSGWAGNVSVVSVTAVNDSATLVAVAAAAGLMNRAGAVVYSVASSYDAEWLAALLPNATTVATPVASLLAAAFGAYGAVVYDGNATELLPTVVTLAGALGAVPATPGLLAAFPGTAVVFNAVGVWATPEAAVSYAAGTVLNATTSLAFQDPALLAGGALVDWLVSRSIFVTYLNNSCIPNTTDHAIVAGLVAAAPWPTPVRVYGYNAMDVVAGGDLFEAETDCINTMGQIATASATNLAFWSHLAPFDPDAPPGSATGLLVQPTPAGVTYNASAVYVALVYGDMDNIDFVQTFGRDHMAYRAAVCAPPASPCFPLTWTLSPNLVELAPLMMRWYYDTAATTGGADWFIMPPSGTLYSYPGQMPPDVQAAYVAEQNAQAALMGTTGSVHWEWVLTWEAAWDAYFPRYVGTNGTRAFFLNNVPWVIPILDMLNETYRIVGDAADPATAVIGFRPAFNWQEGGGGGLGFNASVIAAILSALPPGTITYVYVIQNTDIASLFDMAAALSPDVHLVSYGQLTDLAFQREAALAAAAAGAGGTTAHPPTTLDSHP